MNRKSLIVSFDFPPIRGGISTFLLTIAQSVPPEKVIVLTEKNSSAPIYNFTTYRKDLISRSGLVWPRWLPMLYHMFKIARKEKISLIQVGQILPFGICALVLKKILNIPYIVYVYGQDLIIMRHSEKKMRQIRTVLKHAEAVIGCSHYTKLLAEQNGALPEHTHVLYPCPTVRPSQEYNRQEIESFMAAQGLTGKKILLTVGNLVARKGHDMVLKALPEVIKHTRNIGYIITGKGPQYNHLQQLVRIHQLQQYVKFMPQITHHELHKLYRACDIFIMPTRTLKNKQGQSTDVEGFGIVFVEANLYAKPVIGGDSGGVPEAIKNGFSGLTVNSEDSATIAKAIIKLLTDDPLAKRLGQQGRERALEKFDWHKESKKLIKILNG